MSFAYENVVLGAFRACADHHQRYSGLRHWIKDVDSLPAPLVRVRVFSVLHDFAG